MNTPNAPLFVTGISTDVGKTVVSAILCEYLKFDYWKPIQTGKELGTDSESLKKLVNRPNFKVYEESYLLNEPLSPHAAQKIENENILLEKVNLPTKTSEINY